MTDWYTDYNTSLRKDWVKQDVKDLKRKLITANHILHHHGVVDAYGHISVRHPQNPDIYIMSGYIAPALVSSKDDLIEYWVKDSEPVEKKAKKGYAERFIHGEIFRMYPSINCVVHSHAEAVLPYVTSGVPLVPLFHMAGFLGQNVPVFDIGTMYQPGDPQDMLVRNARFGTGLAERFASVKNDSQSLSVPKHAVVLMRRHGYTTHGVDIETAVYRGIYTKVNAGVQTNAMAIRSVFAQSFGPLNMPRETGPFEFLSKEMSEGCLKMNEGTQDKPWRLWVAEVEKLPLYTNNG